MLLLVTGQQTDQRYEAVSCRRTDGVAGSCGSQRQTGQTRGELQRYSTR